MFTIEADKTINITRGDSASFVVPIEYAFQSGDVLRFKVFRKKACEDVVLQKDFVIEEVTESVSIVLTEQDTRIGKVISKPVDYWYEIELNPENNPQTLIGYDDDGAKILRLYPEGRDIEDDELTKGEVDVLRNILTEFKEDEIPAVAQDYMEEKIPSITQDYVNKNVFPVVDDPEVWELLEGLYKVSGFVAIDNEGVGFYVADKSLLVVNKDGDKTLFYLYLGGYGDFPYDIIIGATDGTTADWYGVESERKKVYEINNKSTHEGYPSALAVYKFAKKLVEDIPLNEYEAIKNKVTTIGENSTDEQYPTAKATYALFSGIKIPENHEIISNKVTEITKESTDEQYPSAKATYTGILKEKSRANNNFANAVKGVANGSVVRIDDVSPIEHTVKINVQGDIENTIVNRYGKNLFHINECNLETTEPWGAKRIGDIDIRTGKYVASCNFKQVGADKSEVALSIRNKDDVTQIIKTVKSTDVEGSLICPFDVSEGVNGVVLFLYSNVTESYLSTECDFTHIQIEAGESATDFEVYKGKETYTPDENGDVTVKSVSPTMTLTTNNANVTLSCEYNKDLNKCISQNTQVVDILTEVSTDEEHTNEQVYGALAMDETLTSFAEALEEKQDKIKNKVFEEIATVTVTADENGDLPTRIVINKDDNGNAFELTDIYCDVIIGMTDGASGRFCITASGTTLFGNTNIDLRSDTLRKWCFRYDSFGENNGGLCTAPNGTLALTAGYPSSNNGNLYGQPVPIGKTVIVRDLQFIGQVGTTKTFMDGTTITLWGVRK